ncbi:hypothetical protein [Acinetobacter sp. ANC 4558]|uniref:hypothetical protein n=1 Tax=Acinetobacter sp. ANC 4558 TaxID=1977876 RepID=UPI001D17D3E5
MSNNHGGKREGAGRKFIYNELTKVLRVPESCILEIKNYLKKTSRHVDILDIHQADPVHSL